MLCYFSEMSFTIIKQHSVNRIQYYFYCSLSEFYLCLKIGYQWLQDRICQLSSQFSTISIKNSHRINKAKSQGQLRPASKFNGVQEPHGIQTQRVIDLRQLESEEHLWIGLKEAVEHKFVRLGMLRQPHTVPTAGSCTRLGHGGSLSLRAPKLFSVNRFLLNHKWWGGAWRWPVGVKALNFPLHRCF